MDKKCLNGDKNSSIKKTEIAEKVKLDQNIKQLQKHKNWTKREMKNNFFSY